MKDKKNQSQVNFQPKNFLDIFIANFLRIISVISSEFKNNEKVIWIYFMDSGVTIFHLNFLSKPIMGTNSMDLFPIPINLAITGLSQKSLVRTK